MSLRALIVDDEPLARKRIRLLGQQEPDLEIIGECANGPEAVAAILEKDPDLVFLDVQMPEMDGFQVLEHLPKNKLPLVLFTTAYDQHAVRAFEAQALDYLLKPFKPERFRAAITRVRNQKRLQQENETAQRLLDLLGSRQTQTQQSTVPERLTRLTVKTPEKVMVLDVANIDSIESAGNYVAVHVGNESHILRDTLSALENQLDPNQFLRVSRSAIVRLDRIRELQPMFKGEHVIVLKNGRQIPMTRGLREVEHVLRFS